MNTEFSEALIWDSSARPAEGSLKWARPSITQVRSTKEMFSVSIDRRTGKASGPSLTQKSLVGEG
ncbi:hypothetical protein EB061_02295 [bacterium]|nr:hypothetical protein [bacterium]